MAEAANLIFLFLSQSLTESLLSRCDCNIIVCIDGDEERGRAAVKVERKLQVVVVLLGRSVGGLGLGLDFGIYRRIDDGIVLRSLSFFSLLLVGEYFGLKFIEQPCVIDQVLTEILIGRIGEFFGEFADTFARSAAICNEAGEAFGRSGEFAST